MPRLARALIALFLLCFALPGVRAERKLVRPPGTTRYAALVRQLTALRDYDKAHAGRMTLSSLGRSIKGRSLWMVALHDPSAEPGSRIFYLCRQHGHEPASTEGALAFIQSLIQAEDGTPLAGYLQKATVYVVPMANPDGAEAFLRHNAHDADLNRDWLRRTQPETRALYSAILRLHPDLMTDQHELYPDDARPDFTEAVSAGSRASQPVVAADDDAQAVVQGAMLAEGFPVVTHWVTDTHPARLAHRYAGIVAGVPTILFETQRLRGSGRTLAARAAAQEQFMLTILRDGAGDRDALIAEAASWQAAHPREVPLLASRHLLVPRPLPPPVETTTE